MAQSAWQPDGSAARGTSRRRPGRLVLLLVWLLIGGLGLPTALAQKGKKGGGKSGAQNQKKKRNKLKPKPKKKEDAKKKKKTVDMLADLKRLPSMNINDALLTKDQYVALEKSLIKRKYQTVLRAGSLAPQDRKVIEDWAKWRIHGMTLPDHRDDLFRTRQKVLYEISYSGNKAGPGVAKQFRAEVMKLVTARCEEVLDKNYYVRLHAVMILGNMNLTEYDVKAKRLPIAFGPAYKPLLEKVLLVPETSKPEKVQPESIKIAAAASLKRIALLAERDPKRDRERAMAAGLIKEFNRRNTHAWYQCRLAEAMAAVELKANPAGQAIIVQALAKAVVDKGRPYPVRAQAAMSLGRACLARDVNIDLLMHEIVNLSVEMSEQFNADLAAGKPLPAHWASSFLRLYFAFQPVDQLEREYLYKQRLDPRDRNAGFLQKGLPQKAQIEAAYKQVKPVVTHVIEQSNKVVKSSVAAARITALRTWLASHTPKDFKVQNGGTLPALRAMRAAQGTPNTINGSSKAVNSVGP